MQSRDEAATENRPPKRTLHLSRRVAGSGLALLAFLWPLLCRAQLTRGVLSGVVWDPSGARIQAAKVSLREQQTGLKREAHTNGIGIYRITALEPGVYTVVIEAAGFKTRQIPDIRIQSSAETILNQALSIADEFTTLEVLGSRVAGIMLGASGGGSNYFGAESVDAMPLTSTLREPQNLALLIPLAVRGPAFSGISAGGQRTRNQNFLLDGTDNNEMSVTGSVLRMIPEELAELQVQYPSLSAEFGHNSGSQVSVITRSGTNHLRATAWDYFRSSHLDPLALTDKRAGFGVSPRFTHNQAGGSLGGALRRDSTFFYTVLEASRRREAPNTRNATAVTIPTARGFADLPLVPLADGQPLGSRLKTLQGLAFLPSMYSSLGAVAGTTVRAINGVPIEFQTLRIPVSAPSNLWHGLLRLDHAWKTAGNLSYRLLADQRYQTNAVGNLQFADRFAAASDVFNQSHTASLSYAFGPNWMTENRFSFTRSHLAFTENDPVSATVQVMGSFSFGGSSSFPQGRIGNIFQWQSSASRSTGKHLLKFGADLRRNRLYNLSKFDQKGTWTFNNFTDYLNSQPSRLRHLLTDATYDARQTNQAYFFQDNIRLSNQLALDLGARYELQSIPLGFFGTSDPAIRQVGVPEPARPDRNNLAPRLGLAYAPSGTSPLGRLLMGEGRTVFRAGYSIQYDVVFLNVLTVTAGNYPRALKYDILAPESYNLFPELQPRPATLPAFDPVRFPFANVPADIQNPASHQWLLLVQRQLGAKQVLELGYLGNRTYHLLRQTEYNPGILTAEQAAAVISGQTIPGVQQRRLHPEWASRATVESTAVSKYHALYVRHQQDLLDGLHSDVSLTWSSAFSDTDEALAVSDIVASSPQVPQNVFDYRSEWSRSVFDRPLRLSVLYSYDTSPLAGRLGSQSLAHQIFSGWKTSGSLEWQSGQPFTVVTGVDSGGSGVIGGWRPNLLPNGVLTPDPVSGDLRTFRANGLFETPRAANGNPLANSMPNGGNLGRNTLRGPAYLLWNVNLSKTIGFTERLKLQLRGDFINFLNHRNFGNPVANLNSAAFGDNVSDPGARSAILSTKVMF